MMNYLINMNRHLRITILLSCFFGSFVLFYFTVNSLFMFAAFVFLGILIASNVSHARKLSDVMDKTLEKSIIKNKIVADHSYLSDDFLSGIAINEKEQRIALFKRNNINEELSPTLFNFDDILEVGIKEDNIIVTHASKTSAIGNAMAGGVLFGGIGAVVGGLSGEKVGYTKVYKVSLLIVVNDLNNPIYEINFLNSKILVDRDSEIYKDIYYEMSKWNKRIGVILKRNELNTRTV
ncbi:hypothetical protein V7128_01305 [Neobacillus vireti]|uniref:hypothetical protein n=1 Tax=Neobacillus vireti TaxID=220686 RepID=UPI0030005F35